MELIGTLHELLAKDRHIEIGIRGADDEAFFAKLSSEDGISVNRRPQEVLISLEPKSASHVNSILSEAITRGFVVEHVMERGADLEALFTKDKDEAKAGNGQTGDKKDGVQAGDKKDGVQEGDKKDGEQAGDKKDGVQAGDKE